MADYIISLSFTLHPESYVVDVDAHLASLLTIKGQKDKSPSEDLYAFCGQFEGAGMRTIPKKSFG